MHTSKDPDCAGLRAILANFLMICYPVACLESAEFPVQHAIRMEIDLAPVSVGKESESLLRIYPSNGPSRSFMMLHIVAHFVDLCPQLSHRPPKRIMDGKCDVCLSGITIVRNPTDIHFPPARQSELNAHSNRLTQFVMLARRTNDNFA